MLQRTISKRHCHMPRIFLKLIGAAAMIGLAACAEEPEFDKARADMTRRERDSTIAASRFPGAPVVKKAMDAADAEAKRAAMFDSAGVQ